MATNLTKNKKRVTLELKPSTLDSLEAFITQTGISRGKALDDLTDMFIETNPRIAANLYLFCQKEALEASNSATSTKSGIERREFEQLSECYLRLSKHFSELATLHPARSNELTKPGLKTIALTDNHEELVPKNMYLINPSEEGMCKHLYLAWFMDPSTPIDDMQAWSGTAPGGIFGFLSKRDDLHVFGQNHALMFKNRADQEECSFEAGKLFNFMVGYSKRIFMEYSSLNTLQFAWSLITLLGTAESKIGTSFAYDRPS